MPNLRPSMDMDGFMTDTVFTHHNYTEMLHWLTFLSRTYPKITHLYSIGKSVLGHDLLVLEISDNPGHHEPGLRKHPLVCESCEFFLSYFLKYFIFQGNPNLNMLLTCMAMKL